MISFSPRWSGCPSIGERSDCTPQLQWQEVVSRDSYRRITFSDMGTGLQHDMASRDDLAQMSDLALFSAFNQNFHLSPRVHHSSVGEEEGTSIDTPTPLSLFTQRHFSRYVVTRGCGVGGTWINRGRVRALRTCTVWNALPKQGLNYCKLQELGVFFVFRKENIIHANHKNFSRPVLYT